MPRRVQRTRPNKKGQRGMPPGSKYVGRPGKFGNLWRVVPHADGTHSVISDWDGTSETVTSGETAARALATARFEDWLHTPNHLQRVSAVEHGIILSEIHELRGWDLACWCPLPEPDKPDHCHAAVLLPLANREQP